MKLKLPKWLPHDKALHIVVGLALFATGWIVYVIEFGVLLAIAGAFLKELNDTYWIIPKFKTSNKRGFSFADFVATFALPLIIYTISEL